MECERFEVLISAYIDDELRDDERQAVEEHLANCRDCGELLSDFGELHALYGELEDVPAPKGFRERVTRRIETPSGARFWQSLKLHRVRYAFSVALLLMLVGGMWFWQIREQALQQSGETLLAGEIEVFAEDILFGNGITEESELLFSEDDVVADDILNDFFLGDTDSSDLPGEAAGFSLVWQVVRQSDRNWG